MSFTFCSSEAIVAKAGRWANSTATASNALLIQFCDEAEHYINTVCRYDFIDNYSNVPTNEKKILQRLASDIAAMDVINYDTSGYPNQIQAQVALDLLRDKINDGVQLLTRDRNVIKFLGGD